MKKCAICLLLSLVFSSPALSEECTSRMQEFVNKTGYKITTARPCNVWLATDALSIPRGEGLVGVLLIADGGEIGIIGSVLQTKAELKLSPELLLKLMQLNNKLDYMKVGIDNDGDLFVRAELHMSGLTAENFSATIKNVVRASNTIYDMLKK